MSAYPTLQSQNYQQLDNSFASKVMMCSMAGLMGAGLMNEGSDTQGLSFVPFLSYFSNLRLGPLDSSSLIYGFKLSLILGTVFYVLSPYFFSPVAFKTKTWLPNQNLKPNQTLCLPICMISEKHLVK